MNYFTGETVMITRDHTCKLDIGIFLRALLAQHTTGIIYLTWDNSYTHFGGDIEVILKEANGRLVLLYLPTYSPWLNPIEMLWRSMRYGVTHCELFLTIDDLEAAFLDYFITTPPEAVQRVIGSKAA